jgi:hypothetical protein
VILFQYVTNINNLVFKGTVTGDDIYIIYITIKPDISINKIINPCNYVYTTHLQGLINQNYGEYDI